MIKAPLSYPSNLDLVRCGDCSLRPRCGGMIGELDIEGCFTHCRNHCQQHGCDYVCPSKLDEFIVSLFEVGGLDGVCEYPVVGPISGSLPFYIPNIFNRSRRIVPLDREVVAVPLYKFVHHQGKKYGATITTAQELRNYFLLKENSKVIVISSGPDQLLENLWEHYEAERVADSLLPLGINGITTPNFSYFLDAPRTEILYNFRRMMIVIEDFARAGLLVIPHLNALTPRDWDDWYSFLKDQPQITSVAMEFQTGLREPERGLPILDQLKRLEDRLGRSIHPILIGGAGYVKDAQKRFGKYSIVDAMPFMKSFKRRRLKQNEFSLGGWQKYSTEPGAPIDRLLAFNIVEYEVRLMKKAGIGFDTDSRQILLPITGVQAPSLSVAGQKLYRTANGSSTGRGQEAPAWPRIPRLSLTDHPEILGSKFKN